MRRLLVLTTALLIGGLAVQAHAEVRINVNIGGPPPIYVAPAPIYVQAAPTMVYLPQPALYVAVGIPYDLYFVGGRYYYFRGNNWYWGPGYGGPWSPVVYRALPPGLQRYQVVRLREYRDREYRVYRSSGRDRYFVADYGPQGRGRGNGHRKH